MVKHADSGRKPSERALRDAQRIAALPEAQQREHPSAVKAEASKLDHVNTYGALPDFYIDRPFCCRRCGAWEIWKAADQKWYYEEAKGHIDAVAVECHECRAARGRGR